MTSRPMPQENSFQINPWFVRVPLLFITGIFLVLMVVLATLVGFQISYSQRIYPGVYAMGIDLSGMTPLEAENALVSNYRYSNDAVFTFRYGEQFWQLSAADLGVRFDVQETVQAAFNIGHSGNIIRNLTGQSEAWFSGQAISPIISYDQNIAISNLEAIATEINRSPVNSSLRLDGINVISTEGQAGRSLDIPATLAQLDAIILRQDTGGEISLIVQETQAMVGSVSATANQIRTALSGPVTLTATDADGNQLGPWTVSVEQIADLLYVSLNNNADGTQSYTVDIDMRAFESYLYELAPGLIQAPRDARFDYDPQTGLLNVIEPAQSGRVLNVAETLARLEDGVFTTTRLVPMAFDYTLPRYHNQVTAEELGITELISEATTYYTGSSSNRRTNIAVGVSKMNGIIVGPGEEFSFNYYLGDISYENGFVDGLVIVADRTESGIGGGICQVSTTLFRTAFNSGLAITERNSHGYRVGYYELNGQPPGLDAAIWQPERDFKFQNNTPHHILVEASVFPGDNALQVRFYSTKHFQVELENAIVRNVEPAPAARFVGNPDFKLGEILQIDFAADGADVTIYRNVFDMNGTLLFEDYAYTHYVPWQAIYEVAPGDTRLFNQRDG